MIKPQTSVELHNKTFLCTKFGGYNLEKEASNAKIYRLIEWSIMRIIRQNLHNRTCPRF